MTFEEWWDSLGSGWQGGVPNSTGWHESVSKENARFIWNASRANWDKLTPWPDSRVKEFYKMERLLKIMASLNTSNQCLDRLQEAVKIAEELTEFDCVEPRASFSAWLHAQSAGFGRGHGD